MSFPRYPAYKDSGVEWLGRLPEHWTAVRLKNVLAQRITDGPHLTPAFVPDGVPFLSVDGIQNGELTFDSCRYVSEDDHIEFSKKVLPQRDDVLMGKAASTGKIARVKVDFEFSIWSPLALIRVDHRVALPSFVEYALKSPQTQAEIDVLCTSNTQKNISMDDIPKLALARPPIEEQAIITEFLDRETAKIDALVAEQEQLITLLKEKRQAVISHAVTKGLDPSVPMKDSGVEWLGEVPEHWDIKRIAQISAKITNGYVGPTRDILVEDGVRYLQSLHIKNNKVEFHQPYFVSEDWSNAHQKSILKTGDVLVVQTGDIGQVAVVPPEFEGCNCHALIIVSPETSSVTGEWLACVLDSDYGFHTLISIQTGALHPHLNCGNVRDVYIPVPALCEQRALVDYVAARSTEFDALIREAVLSIELLRERRSALISAAVTGQIDVRGLAPAQEQAA